MDTVPIIRTIAGLQSFLQMMEATPKPATPVLSKLGLVPTMGALHAGHLSLIERARHENRWVIVSIFVNPLQFAPTEDLDRYPRPLEQDQQRCQAAGVDAIFAPTSSEILGDGDEGLTAVVPPAHLDDGLCGPFRPGHFQGVATIVLKLLNLVRPDRAYFGQKDAQQLVIIQRLVQDLNVPVEIVPCPTVREASGLALSSRNQYLDARADAAIIYQGLQAAQQRFESGVREREALLNTVRHRLAPVPEVEIEYVDLVDPVTLEPLSEVKDVGRVAIATKFSNTRLIDNILLDARPPILAIDGPAGAGKSTVTRLCAQQLGLKYLDTGAMYRAITWLVLQSQIKLDDQLAIADLVSQSDIKLQLDANPDHPPRVWVQQQDVTDTIRSPEVTQSVSAIAAQSAVRQALVRQQRILGQSGGLAAEGRDIGTQVFPAAGLKIFLTASSLERARRRHKDLEQQGAAPISLEQLEQQIAQRDQKDSQRSLSPLCKAYDAIEIDTDGLSIAVVTDQIVQHYRNRFGI
ncbi:Pantothenate synthetase [Acaryochloris thomasi RCC1774]|uniref:Bifunctional pantoate ligase/cytidylate kinase n=1 Tax=Acaryochloris thomasi RCC1774 TaxID=1764569 RepID=A0A2W1JL60_9CYAN|nr:bifunctional pantoate--beta-alanine ligase/(d)CMP kinase [Acaryochloris thomasi]PZD74120.1 Pantothenate synthetase [Acaryochloris thomasi RCC1774]